MTASWCVAALTPNACADLRLAARGFTRAAASQGTVFIQPQRMQFMRYVISHQPYGYQVVTTAPVYVQQSIQERLFKWALPFTRNLWITIACSVIASAILMTLFEHGTQGKCAAPRYAGCATLRRPRRHTRRRGLPAVGGVLGTQGGARHVLQRDGRVGARHWRGLLTPLRLTRPAVPRRRWTTSTRRQTRAACTSP